MLFDYLPLPDGFTFCKEGSYEFDDHKIDFMNLDYYPDHEFIPPSFLGLLPYDRPYELIGESEEKIQYLRECTLAVYWMEQLPELPINDLFRQLAFGLLGEKSYACGVIAGIG
jgi:hypothetical protein